jgi:hypothetical protein
MTWQSGVALLELGHCRASMGVGEVGERGPQFAVSAALEVHDGDLPGGHAGGHGHRYWQASARLTALNFLCGLGGNVAVLPGPLHRYIPTYTESDLHLFFAWSADQHLAPLAVQRVQIERRPGARVDLRRSRKRFVFPGTHWERAGDL